MICFVLIFPASLLCMWDFNTGKTSKDARFYGQICLGIYIFFCQFSNQYDVVKSTE